MTKPSLQVQNTSRLTWFADGARSSLSSFESINLGEAGDLEKLAQQLLEDPIALQKLGDRVFELLEREIRSQRERSCAYGRPLS